MSRKISRCNICDKFFDSKRELRDHKDKNHRITNAKMVMSVVISEKTTKQATAAVKGHYYGEIG